MNILFIQIQPTILDQSFNEPKNLALLSNHKLVVFSAQKRIQEVVELENQNNKKNIYPNLIQLVPTFDFNNIIPLNFYYNFHLSNIINSERDLDVISLVLEKFPGNYIA
ncbi:MAG: hypothetical protein ACFFG0_06880 [Candidatus Thorarchaeota archaeon]